MAIDRSAPLLVTGAGGVLGRAVRRIFVESGFSNVITPTRSELNLLDSEATFAWFDQYRPTTVIHLASVVFGLGGNLKNQFRSIVENTAINSNFFAAIHRFPVEQCFFAGTVASYPFPYSAMPLVEDHFFDGLPHYGEFGYALAKRHAFGFLQILAKEHGLKSTYGVFTNLYGPGDRFDIENGHVIPSLIAKAHVAKAQGVALDVWGDGLALRDFLHAEDAARAILLCLDQENQPDLINISSGQGVSIGNIARTIAQVAEVSDLHFQVDKPVGIPERVVCNMQLRTLGFVPSITLEDGLRSTYEWYLSHHGEVRV